MNKKFNNKILQLRKLAEKSSDGKLIKLITISDVCQHKR